MTRIALIIAGFVGLCAASAASAQGSRTQTEALRQAFQQYAELEQFSGSVLIAQGDDILLAGGFGLASSELNVPATRDNRYVIGSMSKVFTAVTAMLLVEEGLLDLDQPVVEIWQGFEDPSETGITLRQLLSHTSGLNHWNAVDDFLMSRSRLEWDAREIVNLYAAEGLRFEPGEDMRYSSLGFMLVAILIEEVTGQDYHSVLRERVLDPLGMSATGPSTSEITPGLAADYRYDFVHANYENGEYRDPTTQLGTGDLVTSVDDLLIWSQAMQGQRPDVFSQAFLDRIQDAAAGARAFGWNKRTLDEAHPDRVIWHGGLVAGYRSQIEIDLETGDTIILLGNMRNIDANRIVAGVRAILAGEDLSPVRRDLTTEALSISVNEGGAALETRMREIWASEFDGYYAEPVDLLIAAVELRSDDVCDRALPIYLVWLELNAGHQYAGLAQQHGLDCSIRLGDQAQAHALYDRFTQGLEDVSGFARALERIEAMPR